MVESPACEKGAHLKTVVFFLIEKVTSDPYQTMEQEMAGRCIAACSVTADNSLINSIVDQKYVLT